ncbi:MAG TPA: hypothetical protein VFG56_00460 [Candidatus Saccharimonadales bacterium]|nr:hypothetical protein [Candidatus Saccharimonadales bacterium]
MNRLPMYTIVGLGLTLGNLLPTLFGQSPFGLWGILGTLIGGMVGVWVFWKLRQMGYIE